MPHIRETKNFGNRRADHSITFTRNGNSRRINVSPFCFSLGISFIMMMMVGYFAATAYLVFRDDLIGAQVAREARIKHEYEDRIATLRTRLDLVTSRQLLDQQAIENKVALLMKRQEAIGGRGGSLNDLLNRAKKRGLQPATGKEGNIPVPSARPTSDKVQILGANKEKGIDNLKTSSIKPVGSANFASAASSGLTLRGTTSPDGINKIAPVPVKIASIKPFTPPKMKISPHNQKIFKDVAQAMDMIDSSQRQTVEKLRFAANKRSKKIAGVLKQVGVGVSGKVTQHIGGPFVPYEGEVPFEEQVADLRESLDILDQLAAKARKIPVSNPASGHALSSRYGARIDPFNGRRAMHAGLDFKASTGDKIRATANGTVIHAGRRGGYGNLVEIKHANGFTTRYGHLSRIKVKVGQKVTPNTVIGLAGSTGRSTGPHLHYEIRKNGKSRDPLPYIRAGKKIRGII